MAVIAAHIRERFLHSHHIPEEVPEEVGWSAMKRTDLPVKTMRTVQVVPTRPTSVS